MAEGTGFMFILSLHYLYSNSLCAVCEVEEVLLHAQEWSLSPCLHQDRPATHQYQTSGGGTAQPAIHHEGWLSRAG